MITSGHKMIGKTELKCGVIGECLECAISQCLPNGFKGSGIYGIRHSASGRIYVGSSVDVRSRLYQHFGALGAKKHHSRYLQNAWDKYGEAAFVVSLLERTVAEKLTVREQFWIDHFDSYEKGFNARPKAESTRGIKWLATQNEARRRSNKKAWADRSLREKLSRRFKGSHRGTWTATSHAKVSATLKQRHGENPKWRANAQRWLHSPENEAKRIASIRASLKRPEVHAARVKHLHSVRELPARMVALRKAYFRKYHRDRKFKTPEEMDQTCLRLYREGKSCRQIGRFLEIDHHGVSSRLRRLGVFPARGRSRQATNARIRRGPNMVPCVYVTARERRFRPRDFSRCWRHWHEGCEEAGAQSL